MRDYGGRWGQGSGEAARVGPNGIPALPSPNPLPYSVAPAMPFRATQRFIRRQPHGSVLFIALVATGLLTWWAIHTQPRTRLISQARIGGGATVPFTPMKDRPYPHFPHRAWTIDLRLDPSLPAPGPRWIIHEGKSLGSGYELHWQPDDLVLQLYRTPRTFLLGSVKLEASPQTVRLIRQGGRFEVETDGVARLLCFDPVGVGEEEQKDPKNGAQAVEPMRAWSCWTEGGMGDATMTVQHHWDDPAFGADLPAIAGPDDALAQALTLGNRPDQSLLAVRQALKLVEGGRKQGEILTAIGAARIAIDPESVLSGSGADISKDDLRDQQRSGQANQALPHLRLWLGLARAERAFAAVTDPRSDGIRQEEVVVSEIGELEVIAAAGDGPIPELGGMILHLLPRLCALAAQAPSYPEAPAAVIDRRQVWIAIAGQATAMALETGREVWPRELVLRLRLIEQMLSCLNQGSSGSGTTEGGGWAGVPQPTPVSAPVWLTSRWRAAAGADPRFDRYPAIPAVADDPLERAIEILEPALGLSPISAVKCRASIPENMQKVVQELGSNGVETRLKELQQELAIAPTRTWVISQALVSLRLAELAGDANLPIIWPERAYRDLVGAVVDGSKVIHTDPVAFALAQLLLARYPRIDTEWYGMSDETRQESAPKEAAKRRNWIPNRLKAYAALLSGKEDAVHFIWVGGLAPSEAVIAALAMQEVWRLREPASRPAPDWSLLRRLTCLTLPADLLIPIRAVGADGPAAGEGAGVQTP